MIAKSRAGSVSLASGSLVFVVSSCSMWQPPHEASPVSAPLLVSCLWMVGWKQAVRIIMTVTLK